MGDASDNLLGCSKNLELSFLYFKELISVGLSNLSTRWCVMRLIVPIHGQLEKKEVSVSWPVRQEGGL